MAAPAPYNFFGQSPAPQAFSPSPEQLAQAMQMPEYNNATSSNAQPSQGSGMSSIDPKMFAKMMRSQQDLASDGLQVGKLYNGGSPSDIPQNAQSFSLGSGPLPWLPQNALPWSGS